MNILSVVLGLGTGLIGGVGGGVGLSHFWLERTKAKWNKELEALKDKLSADQRRYQAQLDRSIFVSRAHFDTEFQAIKEVHQCLSEVKILFRKLYPIEDRAVLDEREWVQTIGDLRTANLKYVAKLEEWGVFLEPAQYDDFKRCYDAADHAIKIPRRGLEYDRDWTVTREHFGNSYQAACQKARDRIAKLAVLPER
jgi:hypothetical protein